MDDQTKLTPEQSAEDVVVNDVEKKEEVVKDPSDEMTPEHPRFKDVLNERNELRQSVAELKAQMSAIQTQVAQRQNETGDETLTAEEEIALARVEKLLVKKGFTKKEELDAMERINKRASQMDKLGDKYNGTNGLPRFDSVEVIEHARRNGFSDDNLEAAYKDLHFDAIVTARAQKLNRPQVPDSEKATGQSRQLTPQITLDDVPNLSDADYEKNRSTILERMKSAARRASHLD